MNEIKAHLQHMPDQKDEETRRLAIRLAKVSDILKAEEELLASLKKEYQGDEDAKIIPPDYMLEPEPKKPTHTTGTAEKKKK